MIIFSLLRMGLLLRNVHFADDVPLQTLLQSFFVGARFDAAITCYLLSPLLFWGLIPFYGLQYQTRMLRFFPWLLSLVWSPLIFLGLAEFEFYREFHDRFNQLAIQYLLDDHATVISMVWNGYPVIPYLILWLVLTVLMGYALKLQINTTPLTSSFTWKTYLGKVLPVGLVLAAVLVIGARGGIQQMPLRWGDAYFSRNTFANHLALNGIFTLSKAALERQRHVLSRFWINRLPQEHALATARQLVLQQGDRVISDDGYALLRYPGSAGRTLAYDHPPRNVVLIIMESLSGEFVGTMGAPYGATPNLDRLAQKGILFDRFFSQGTHTHQGLFVTTCSFPNLPGFEYLMKNNLGQQPFRSFISLLHEQGFRSIYVYNGSFTWDNQEGFFRNQGMKYFVGRDDYRNPKFKDPTWGVSDEDMFLRGVEEISKLAAQGPTFALLQTLSNHAPFNLPAPAPFSGLSGPEELMPRLNGIRYSDWALGRFFDLAGREPWFNDTLFVIVGDHGFAYRSPMAMMDLSSYHVPLLLYYPRDAKGANRKIHTVGSQVDVLPTVMGLMGIRSLSQSWGRDLFRLAPADQGWAVIKPSGSGQTVGLVKGDRLFVISPKLNPSAYQFRLNPWTATQISLSPETAAVLSEELHGYIQTGINALMTFRAGVPADRMRILKNSRGTSYSGETFSGSTTFGKGTKKAAHMP
ncbi:MAG: LTA synthase family protein [Nitrospirota bacterium]|nr:LTA synthase family protein [Nitrospirota bacterium]